MEHISPALYSEDTIFHYTKMSVVIEHILYEKRFMFSVGCNTNDPREYRDIDIEPYSDGEYGINDFLQDWGKADKEFKKVISNYRFACFYSNELPKQRKDLEIFDDQPTSFGYERLRMWAQYGEGFHGVCIGFSNKLLLQQLREILGGEATIHAQLVKYEKSLKKNHELLSNANANGYKNKDKKQWAEKYVESLVKDLFFVKHADYRDENEYRIVVHDPDKALEKGLDVTGCITAVILGDRANPAYNQILASSCTQMKAECKRLVWEKGRLELKDVEV